jgi:phosphoglycerate dehydrogenase-like enzyme
MQMSPSQTIWCNANFPEAAMQILKTGIGANRLILSSKPGDSILAAGAQDETLAQADIAFGQPDPKQLFEIPRIKWVHLTTAGYARYDTDEFRSAMKARGTAVTNSSSVFAEPCAQHLLAMMMGLARRLPQAMAHQVGDRRWDSDTLRRQSYLLQDQQVLIYGYGAIARRLAELLAPLNLKLIGVRRRLRGDETIPTVTVAQADALLPDADHVVDILPQSSETDGFFDAGRFARMKSTATFYNIGRGATVDQSALQSSLEGRTLAAAYLDVTVPEPLPPQHPLWQAPNCFITPHSAGGHSSEFERSVRHFLANLNRYFTGGPLNDRLI